MAQELSRAEHCRSYHTHQSRGSQCRCRWSCCCGGRSGPSRSAAPRHSAGCTAPYSRLQSRQADRCRLGSRQPCFLEAVPQRAAVAGAMAGAMRPGVGLTSLQSGQPVASSARPTSRAPVASVLAMQHCFCWSDPAPARPTDQQPRDDGPGAVAAALTELQLLVHVAQAVLSAQCGTPGMKGASEGGGGIPMVTHP